MGQKNIVEEIIAPNFPGLLKNITHGSKKLNEPPRKIITKVIRLVTSHSNCRKTIKRRKKAIRKQGEEHIRYKRTRQVYK